MQQPFNSAIAFNEWLVTDAEKRWQSSPAVTEFIRHCACGNEIANEPARVGINDEGICHECR